MCVTDRHDMTLAVKVALNPNTTNQQLAQMGYVDEEEVILNLENGIHQ